MSEVTPRSKSSYILPIISASIGNMVEWADWSIYGLTATFIAANFFPAADPTVALLQAFAVFAIGFIIRPVGSMVLGPYGDKYGRNKALSWSIIIMALGTGAIAIIPTYSQIGIWAPIAVIAARLVQGFAAGGEWGTAATFIYEFSPKKYKSFFSSFRAVGTGAGFFFGSLIVTIITSTFSAAELAAWGWRVPYVLAFFMGVVGLYIRTKVDETPDFKEAQAQNDLVNQPIKELAQKGKKAFAVVFGLCLVLNGVYYIVITYIPTYLKMVAHVPLPVAMQINTIATFIYTALVLVFGWMGDKVPKRNLLAVSSFGYVLLTIPGFMLLGSGDYMTILVVQSILSILMSIFVGPITVVVSELFPTQTRSTAVSLVYTLNVSLFGGTAPMIATWLTQYGAITPAYYVVLMALISGIAALYIKENKDREVYV